MPSQVTSRRLFLLLLGQVQSLDADEDGDLGARLDEARDPVRVVELDRDGEVRLGDGECRLVGGGAELGGHDLLAGEDRAQRELPFEALRRGEGAGQDVHLGDLGELELAGGERVVDGLSCGDVVLGRQNLHGLLVGDGSVVDSLDVQEHECASESGDENRHQHQSRASAHDCLP